MSNQKPSGHLHINTQQVYEAHPLLYPEQTVPIGIPQRYAKYLETITNCPPVANVVQSVRNLILRSVVRVEPSNDSPEALRIADLLMKSLTHVNLAKVLAYMSSYYFMGAAFAEFWYDNKGDHYGIAAIQPRYLTTIAQVSLDGVTGELEYVQQSTGSKIPAKKILHVADDFLVPASLGVGALRHVVNLAAVWINYSRLEASGYSTCMNNNIIMRVPLADIAEDQQQRNLTPDQAKAEMLQLQQTLLKAATTRDASKPEGLFVDSAVYTSDTGVPSTSRKYDIETRTSYTQNQADISKAILRLERMLYTALGVDVADTGTGNSKDGTLLIETTTDSFYVMTAAILDTLLQAVQSQVVSRWMQYNGFDATLTPQLTGTLAKTLPPAIVAKTLMDVGKSGFPLDGATVTQLLNEMNLAVTTAEEYDRDIERRILVAGRVSQATDRQGVDGVRVEVTDGNNQPTG